MALGKLYSVFLILLVELAQAHLKLGANLNTPCIRLLLENLTVP